jgi:RNA polymerase sigma-70 factor (sigma-E family)
VNVDHEAFDRFARAELPRLLRYAVMLTGEREQAQDLVQDVLVKVYDQWPRVGGADRPDRYVTRMVTHEFLSWKRRWHVRHIFASDNLVALSDRSGVIDEADARATHDDLWHRIGELAPRQRAVLVLRFYEGLPDAEIADLLGCTTSTVRGYAHRALSALRLGLAPEGPTPSATTVAEENR